MMSDSEEELVGGEAERTIRAALASGGQIMESINRLRRERAQTKTTNQPHANQEIADTSGEVLRAVKSDEYWKSAGPAEISDVVSYGANISSISPNGKRIYDTAASQIWDRFGLDINAVRVNHPDNEHARNQALMYALDDRIAKQIARESADDVRADNDRDLAHPGEPLGEVPVDAAPRDTADAAPLAEKFDAEADFHGARESEHMGQARLLDSTSRDPRAQAQLSYPEPASTVLTESRTATKKSNPKPQRQRGRARSGRESEATLDR